MIAAETSDSKMQKAPNMFMDQGHTAADLALRRQQKGQRKITGRCHAKLIRAWTGGSRNHLNKTLFIYQTIAGVDVPEETSQLQSQAKSASHCRWVPLLR
jgi:hypothetical protein